ncbi:hypothetical protein EVAR_96642_1 [Eumeta japonica]|uniref:Uncharacterized protein n=1 Tax=Eumeta variegata TaxID=151549 RepID=A0A4C1WSL8_EUMVA|nr:hypothetical protein EVAR_96642_1 [Eumeta japonica]
MSRRPSIRDLELKLKAALLELKASKEMCDCLISERDGHETEIRSVIFMNTKLKGELAEMDVKCNDLTDQRDRLRVLMSEMDDCRNHYEQSLLQIQVLQEEHTSSNKKTEQSIALNNKNASIPESVTSALHAVINNENETVIYSDELGIGLGPMLSGYMNHRAFDCVHHETLIGKLRHYGVTGRALDLLKSYLSNRVQRVDVNVRNKELEFVNSTVFLGITLDDRLQWGPHIIAFKSSTSIEPYELHGVSAPRRSRRAAVPRNGTHRECAVTGQSRTARDQSHYRCNVIPVKVLNGSGIPDHCNGR